MYVGCTFFTRMTTSTEPSELEPIFSFIISGSSVDVCVESKEAAVLKLILRDSSNKRDVAIGKRMCISSQDLL